MNLDDSHTICPESGESSQCSNSEWPLIPLNIFKVFKKFDVVINHCVYFGFCIPALGRDGCLASPELPDRYKKCDVQELLNREEN